MKNINSMMGTIAQDIKGMIYEELEITNAKTKEKRNKQSAPRPMGIRRERSLSTSTAAGRPATDEPPPPTRENETDMNLGNYSNTTDENDDGEWTQVIRGGRQQRQRQPGSLIGTGSRDCALQAADKTAWLHIGRLREGTKEQDIKSYLNKKGIQGNVTCEQLTSISSNKSFKIGIPFNFLEQITDPEFWPAGITVRRFRFFRRREGAYIEH